MPDITPFLWFNNCAEEAIALYQRAFKDSRLIHIQRYPAEPAPLPHPEQAGRVLTAVFELAGSRLMALDGGPTFAFTPAVSLFVECATPAELEQAWETLVAGGSVLMPLLEYPGLSGAFGWLADRYGLSWQLHLSGQPQQVTPCLTFVAGQHGRAEAAMHFYSGLLAPAGIDAIARYDDSQPALAGTVQMARFRLAGRPFMALDGGPDHAFGFTEAVSLHVACATQAEVDALWPQLSAEPAAEQCGWLKDRFGLSWQIVPQRLAQLLDDPDPQRVQRVTQALLQMKKIDLATLEQAHAG